MLDDGQEPGADLFAAGLVQVLGGRVIAAAEDALGIFHGHFLNGIDQDRLGLGHGGFRRFVHAGFQFIDLITHAELLHFAGDLAQFARQFDFYVRVVAEPAWGAKLFYGQLRALGQGVLETAGGVFLRQVAEGQRECARGNHQACAQAGKAKGRAEHESFLVRRMNLADCVDADFQELRVFAIELHGMMFSGDEQQLAVNFNARADGVAMTRFDLAGS
ncbi:hypothetical protein D3C81_707760 [compost metagenome]